MACRDRYGGKAKFFRLDCETEFKLLLGAGDRISHADVESRPFYVNHSINQPTHRCDLVSDFGLGPTRPHNSLIPEQWDPSSSAGWLNPNSHKVVSADDLRNHVLGSLYSEIANILDRLLTHHFKHPTPRQLHISVSLHHHRFTEYSIAAHSHFLFGAPGRHRTFVADRHLFSPPSAPLLCVTNAATNEVTIICPPWPCLIDIKDRIRMTDLRSDLPPDINPSTALPTRLGAFLCHLLPHARSTCQLHRLSCCHHFVLQTTSH